MGHWAIKRRLLSKLGFDASRLGNSSFYIFGTLLSNQSKFAPFARLLEEEHLIIIESTIYLQKWIFLKAWNQHSSFFFFLAMPAEQDAIDLKNGQLHNFVYFIGEYYKA